MTLRNPLLYLSFVVLIGMRIFTIHNSFDSIPFARASVTNWLNNDWYLSQSVPYRFLFNVVAGYFYEFTNFWTAFFSLKVLQFGLLALAFSRLLPKFGLGLLTSLLFLAIFSSNQSMVAGEWMYGDSDTKPFAYICFLFSMSFLFEQKYKRSAFLMGLSASFHVLVGGYLSIVYFLVYLVKFREQLLRVIGPYVGGALIAFYAVFLELSGNSNPNDDLIYVLSRVPHHVFPDWKFSRWVYEYLFFNVLFLWVYFKGKSQSLKTLVLFPLFSNVFWILGLIVYYSGNYAALKYYFFRVPDTLIPFSAFLILCIFLDKWIKKYKFLHYISSFFILFAITTHLIRGISATDTNDHQDVYEWIKENTPKNAVFLTDPTDSLFYINAERAVVASYKHSPQKNSFFNEWLERLEFVTDASLSRTKPIKKKDLREAYRLRNPDKNFDLYEKFGVSYVVSEIPITSERFKEVYEGKFLRIYEVQRN